MSLINAICLAYLNMNMKYDGRLHHKQHRNEKKTNNLNKLMLPLLMLNISVSFFNISSKFVQTFCPICQQASACLNALKIYAVCGV